MRATVNLSSTTSRDSRHPNKVKVEGLGRNSSDIAGGGEKKLLKIFLSSIKTNVAIKFPKKKKMFCQKSAWV